MLFVGAMSSAFHKHYLRAVHISQSLHLEEMVELRVQRKMKENEKAIKSME